MKAKLLPRRGRILDIRNLAEEPLEDLIEKLAKDKASVRLQGLIICPKLSYELYIDFKEGKPVLVILKSEDEELKGDVAWREFNRIMSRIAGFIEVYELDDKDIEEDLKIRPDAAVKISMERDVSVEVAEKIEEYSIKLSTVIPLKTIIIVNSVHLNARAELASSAASLSAVITNEIEASENACRYIFSTIYDSELWKSLEILARNKRVLAAILYRKDKILTGVKALKIILNPDLLGKYTHFDILIYDVKIDPIQLLEEEKLKIPITKRTISTSEKAKKKVEAAREPLIPIKEEKRTEEIRRRRRIDINLDSIRAKANEYFFEVIDTLGYELEKLTIQLNTNLKFKVRIRRKRFTLRRASIKKVRRRLIEEARWILEELRYKIPFEVEIEVV